ncbi:heterogeneous nuclear ribonucleoprotein A1, A2/B1-like protein [Iris pallida]|uniref:Heterogeneous nuclear ribonucleoprotein A1, A2/B1-like protein n=1 Tax=Iris pallida TaxID=29817 RepID=A0AAX6H872_IRIPA|nr:heterogeneous nuclear ribonucleoprotein A1, A2/B1-like protein [Iris pallida]KAJ6845267.1 heterogeneous nuclear ribonucleoprotein A1, A2/B1-like protein [Iris pallida]
MASSEPAAVSKEEEEQEEVMEEEVEEEVEEEEPEEEAVAVAGDKKEADGSNTNNSSNAPSTAPSIDGASPGKIFVGGLPKDTTEEAFSKHFGKYGKITDLVIMKHRGTGHPRGFGFITYEDPSVVDAVILDEHDFGGKKVEIKRTIPKGAISGKDFKTKKIFVGGIPTLVNEDELKNYFAKFGEVEEHLIMRDHSSGRSRGFGFVTFSSEKVVDDLLTKGNRIEFAGVQVEIKKAEPKKAGYAPLPPAPTKHFGGNPRPAFGRGGYREPYDPIDSGAYRYGSRPRSYGGGYGGSEFDAGYGGYGSAGVGAYRGEASLPFSSRYGGGGGGGGGGLGRGYDHGGYDGPIEGYGRYVGAGGYGSAYDSGAGYGYGAAGGYGTTGTGMYGGPRRDYGDGPSGRYHPYTR